MKTIHSATEAEAREEWRIAIANVPAGSGIKTELYPVSQRIVLRVDGKIETVIKWGGGQPMTEKKNYCDADGMCTAENIIEILKCKHYKPCDDVCCSDEATEDKYCFHSKGTDVINFDCTSDAARKEASK